MDPLTLFALANGAVSAVKAGCKLYKDIQSAAGDVKGILKDLDKQFNDKYRGKPIPYEAKRQFNEEKQRVIELNKRDPDDIYTEIGDHLSVYFENYAKCIAIFEEEERKSAQYYTGTDSVGKRALQRVLMRKKLQKMETDLRELMIYQCPPELGALYTDIEEMSKRIEGEQKIAFKKQLELDKIKAKRERAEKRKLYGNICLGLSCLGACVVMGIMMAFLVEDRVQKYPHLGNGWLPKSEFLRSLEEPMKYIGR